MERCVSSMERSFVNGKRFISCVEGDARTLDRHLRRVGRSVSSVVRSQEVWRDVQVVCRAVLLVC